jgi:protein-L-isoaspartate(D-aspartate) O-methyltransferase
VRRGAAALTAAAVAAVLLAAALVAAALVGRPAAGGLPVGAPGSTAAAGERAGGDGASADDSDRWAAARARMVEDQIRARGVTDARVLAAMREVPRHRFVPESERGLAYSDQPLPIGWGQTISQPYIVALMCSLLDLAPGDRVLEIGTGSGYHAAVLSQLAGEVYSIEIVEPLGRRAGETLAALGYDNVRVRVGDGYEGWPEHAPFDAVVLTAAPPEVPGPLLEQLAVGGRLVVPVGGAWEQELQVITRTADDYRTEHVAPVRFVPMTGKAGG